MTGLGQPPSPFEPSPQAQTAVDVVLKELHSYAVGPDYHELEWSNPAYFAEMRANLIETVDRVLSE